MHQMTASEHHHDLTEVLQRYLLVVGNFFHLHGAANLVIVGQLRERKQSIMAL